MDLALVLTKIKVPEFSRLYLGFYCEPAASHSNFELPRRAKKKTEKDQNTNT